MTVPRRMPAAVVRRRAGGGGRAAACALLAVAALLPRTTRTAGSDPARSPSADASTAGAALAVGAAHALPVRPRRRTPSTECAPSQQFALARDEGAPNYTSAQLWRPSLASNKVLRAHAHAGCLLGTPRVLEGARPFALALPRRAGMAAFNPSVVRYGASGYLVAYRVDWQHACAGPPIGPFADAYYHRGGEKHTSLVATDGALRPRGPPRLLAACGEAVGRDDRCKRATVDPSTQIVDARLARAPPDHALSGGVGGSGEGVMARAAISGAAAPGTAAAPAAAAPPPPDVYVTYLADVHHAADRCAGNLCNWATQVARLRLLPGRPAPGVRPQEWRRLRDGGGGGNRSDDWRVALEPIAGLCAPAAVSGRNHALILGRAGRVGVQAWIAPRVVSAQLLPPPRAAPPRPPPAVNRSTPQAMPPSGWQSGLQRLPLAPGTAERAGYARAGAGAQRAQRRRALKSAPPFALPASAWGLAEPHSLASAPSLLPLRWGSSRGGPVAGARSCKRVRHSGARAAPPVARAAAAAA